MPDGIFIDWEIGRADAPNGIKGHWQIEGAERVRVSFEENIRPPQILEILKIDAEILKVRQSVSS